jgi:hypothetical protein
MVRSTIASSSSPSVWILSQARIPRYACSISAVSSSPLPAGYSFILPYRTPSMRRCFAVPPYSDHTNSSVLCACVIACNHLMLYLREAARRPTSTEPPSCLPSRPTTDVVFAPHDTHSYDDRSQTTPLRKHDAQNPGRKPGTSHELEPSSRFTSRVSSEMD